MTSVRHIRLINGDELIADFISSFKEGTKEKIRLKNALVVQKNDIGDVILVSYNPFSSNDSVEFDSSHVLNITDVHKEVERYYSNSLICNRKFLDETMIDRIKATNHEIESQLSDVSNEHTEDISPRHTTSSKSYLAGLKSPSKVLN